MRSLCDITTIQFSSKRFKKALAWGLIALGTAMPFLLVPFEVFRFRDEPYQALCCLEYERAYAAMLTFFVGDKWMSLFGQSFIVLRCLMTLCFEATAAIGCVYIRRRGVGLLPTATIYLISTSGLILSYLPIYNWDSGAYPVTALGLCCLLSYTHAPSKLKVVVMGAIAGLMTLFRLPLAAVLAIMAIFIIVKSERFKVAITNIGVLFTLAVIVFALGATIMVGSPGAYFAAMSGGNTVAGHTMAQIPEIAQISIGHIYSQYQYMLPGIVAILLGICFTKIGRANALLWIGALLLLYYTTRSIVMNHDEWTFWWSHNGILIPVAVICIYFTPLVMNLNATKIARDTALGCWALTAFILLQAFGSDSVAERLGWGMAFIFSFGVNKEAMHKHRKFTNYLLGFTAIFVMSYFTMVFLRLNNVWATPIKAAHATTINGTRNYPSFNYFEEIDSVKSILDTARNAGIATSVIGEECATYTFILEEKGPNSAMRFYLTESDVINDVNSIDANVPRIVAWMDEAKTEKVDKLLRQRGFIAWKQIGDHFSILANESARRQLSNIQL